MTEGPAADDAPNVCFSNLRQCNTYKIGLDAGVSLFAEQTARTDGMIFGPNGRLDADTNSGLPMFDPAA